ncbi:MAG: hypothetical protein HOO89_09505 [Ferruginibacter sp.]|nr:hypothetical protein [Ferruginibacter sp.]
MKKILFTILVVSASFALKAQELAQDQNPNYKVSMDKYTAAQATLQTTMNTTVQNTYTAYDWRIAKSKRKAENRSYRRERALSNQYYYNNNYGYRNNYNQKYYRHRCR